MLSASAFAGDFTARLFSTHRRRDSRNREKQLNSYERGNAGSDETVLPDKVSLLASCITGKDQSCNIAARKGGTHQRDPATASRLATYTCRTFAWHMSISQSHQHCLRAQHGVTRTMGVGIHTVRRTIISIQGPSFACKSTSLWGQQQRRSRRQSRTGSARRCCHEHGHHK